MQIIVIFFLFSLLIKPFSYSNFSLVGVNFSQRSGHIILPILNVNLDQFYIYFPFPLPLSLLFFLLMSQQRGIFHCTKKIACNFLLVILTKQYKALDFGHSNLTGTSLGNLQKFKLISVQCSSLSFDFVIPGCN